VSVWRQSGFWLNVLLVLAGGAIVLLVHQDTLRETAFTILVFVALASSLNILMGYAGYINFGHIVFFGLGGYFGFYLISVWGLSLYLAVLGGGLFSALIAYLFGVAVLHLRGAYFALATIGINEAAKAFVTNFGPFGGAIGLSLNFSVFREYGGAAKALWLTFILLWLITGSAWG
jgi:branched-chain amino acid transport system permease protein